MCPQIETITTDAEGLKEKISNNVDNVTAQGEQFESHLMQQKKSILTAREAMEKQMARSHDLTKIKSMLKKDLSTEHRFRWLVKPVVIPRRG